MLNKYDKSNVLLKKEILLNMIKLITKAKFSYIDYGVSYVSKNYLKNIKK